MRGGTLLKQICQRKFEISIHPPRAGRDMGVTIAESIQDIFQSTRPVRGGTRFPPTSQTSCSISIHPPRAGRDGDDAVMLFGYGKFQSTRPVRGGTRRGRSDHPAQHISIHPPRAGRDHSILFGDDEIVISIHPPRAGRDVHIPAYRGMILRFQSTRPVRGGTSFPSTVRTALSNFNPPAPCGAGRRSPRSTGRI